ncbi:M6 family metalloprotease domain-containing protein [Nakamurella sp. GG22]
MPVPFHGEEFTLHNPEGSEVRVRGWGNQFHAVFETPDGYTVVKDPASGFFHYARLSDDGGQLLPTGARAGTDPGALGVPPHLRVSAQAAKRSAATARDRLPGKPRWEVRREQRKALKRAAADSDATPEGPADLHAGGALGTSTGLCLLIFFPDVPVTISQAEIQNFCNQTGYTGFGNNGSVSDYFSNVSGGKLKYTNIVTAYYKSKHTRGYYTDPAIPYGTRAQELITEALTDLKGKGFDFSRLSVDPGGYVYALNVLYAGQAVNNWSEGLWPHSWSLGNPFVVSATRTFFDYQITNIGDALTLRTFCHENGHMVCDFPDLYDYGYESYGVGDFCLMCYGGSDTNPTEPCAYLKYRAGWAAKVTTLTAGVKATLTTGVNDFLLHRRNTNEYFILENRQQTGRDASLPDRGLAIWHVDKFGSNNNEQMTPAAHYECSLEQADNRFDIEHGFNLGDTDDLFGAPTRTAFGVGTSPASKWWDATASGLEIVQVSAPAETMTVTTKGKGGQIAMVNQVHIKTANRYYLQAVNGGGGDVTAKGPWPREWETFDVVPVAGDWADATSGSTVNLRTWDGHLVSITGPAGAVTATGTDGTIPETRFVLVFPAGEPGLLGHYGRFGLRAANGKFVCAEGGGNGVLVANRAAMGPWETFEAIRHPEPADSVLTTSIRTVSKVDFLQAVGGGGADLSADSPSPVDWATFDILAADRASRGLRDGARVNVRTECGHYLQAEGGGGGKVTAAGIWPREWETFTLVVPGKRLWLRPNGPFGLRTAKGNYVEADHGGGGIVLATATTLTPAATFTATNQAEPTNAAVNGTATAGTAETATNSTQFIRLAGGVGSFRTTYPATLIKALLVTEARVGTPGARLEVRIVVDGQPMQPGVAVLTDSTTYSSHTHSGWLNVQPGYHNIDVEWRTTTGTAYFRNRTLTVQTHR